MQKDVVKFFKNCIFKFKIRRKIKLRRKACHLIKLHFLTMALKIKLKAHIICLITTINK